jgi:integrase
MSRRGGQDSTPFRAGKWWRVRVRFDVEGLEERQQRSLKVAPVSLKLSKPELQRRAAEVIAKSGANSEQRFNQIVLGEVTFKQQAKVYLREAVSRNREPLRSTVSIEGALTKHVFSVIGELPLSMVNNLSVKPLVRKMVEAGLSPRTVEKYTLYVKQVVASLKTPDGEPMHPRVWDAETMDLPLVQFNKQKRPALMVEGVNDLIDNAKPGQMRVLFILLAATGLRISEALALESKHFIHGGRSILVEQQVDKDCPRIVHYLKTDAAFREVDLHSEIAAYMRAYVSHKTGLIFHTQRGTPYLYHNIETRWLDPILTAVGLGEMSWHSFRRFRNSWLRARRCQEDHRMHWLGHQPREMGEIYSALKKDLAARWEEVDRCGYGFSLPKDVVPNVPRIGLHVVSKTKSAGSQKTASTRILVNRMAGTPREG